MPKHILWLLPAFALLFAGCQASPAVVAEGGTATATLAPIVSLTPRLTATQVPTRTPRPTTTPVPPTRTPSLTPSITLTPSEIPPVIGVVNSIERVNVRTGPGISYRDFAALAPGSGVEIIGQSSDGNWLNVKLEDDREGWMAASLIRIQPTPTAFPTFTPTVDETSIALGTDFPTAVVGGETVTPTLPVVIAADVSPTPVISDTPDPDATATTPTPSITPSISVTPRNADIDSTPVLLTNTPSPSPTTPRTLAVDEAVVPVIDIDAINATATALSERGAVAPVTPTETATASPLPEEARILPTPLPADASAQPGLDGTQIAAASAGTIEALAPRTVVITEEAGVALTEEVGAAATEEIGVTEEANAPLINDATLTALPTAAVRRGNTTPQSNPDAVIRNGVDVLAYCGDESFDAAPPDNLKAGSTVDVFWIWYARTEAQIQDHLLTATYDVRVNDNPLPQINSYRQPVRASGDEFAVSWFVPIGPLAAGDYTITYRVTWSRSIFDGYQYFGPNTNIAEEVGSCTFTVYE